MYRTPDKRVIMKRNKPLQLELWLTVVNMVTTTVFIAVFASVHAIAHNYGAPLWAQIGLIGFELAILFQASWWYCSVFVPGELHKQSCTCDAGSVRESLYSIRRQLEQSARLPEPECHETLAASTDHAQAIEQMHHVLDVVLDSLAQLEDDLDTQLTDKEHHTNHAESYVSLKE